MSARRPNISCGSSNQTSPFSVRAKTTGTEVRFDLRCGFAVPGFGEAGSGSGGGFSARDVCSATQRRIRRQGPRGRCPHPRMPIMTQMAVLSDMGTLEQALGSGGLLVVFKHSPT
jgi:hypothetical protein